MLFRLLMESFLRQRRRKMLAGIAILLGTTAVTAMLALATTIGDRIHKELAVYGANIIVYPKAEQLEVKVGGVDIKPASSGFYLKESDLEKLHGIFWANNITGISPEFELPTTGLLLAEGQCRAAACFSSCDCGSITISAVFKRERSIFISWWRIEWPLPG